MVVLHYPVDQQGVGCTARHAVEVSSNQHGDVSTRRYLLQALEKRVHLHSNHILFHIGTGQHLTPSHSFIYSTVLYGHLLHATACIEYRHGDLPLANLASSASLISCVFSPLQNLLPASCRMCCNMHSEILTT